MTIRWLLQILGIGECGGGGSGDIKVDDVVLIKRLLNGDLTIKLYVSMS